MGWKDPDYGTGKRKRRKGPDGRVEVKRRVTNEEMTDAIVKYLGNLSAAADYLGIHRSTIHRRLEKYPEMQEVFVQVRERNLDDLEDELFTQAKNGNITALIFALKTQGAHRGYQENRRVEVDGKWVGRTTAERTVKDDAAYLAAVMAELQGGDDEEDVKAEVDDTES